MSRLTKRYLKSTVLISISLILIMILPVFNCRKKEIKASVHQNAEISFVTVKKKALSQKQISKKIENEKSIPSENPASKQKEDIPEENEPTEENTENTDNGVSDTEKTAVKKATSTYKEYVLSRIAAKKTYPIAAIAKGMEGRVKIHLTVSPTGEITVLEIKQECSYGILNEAALSAVKKAAPFKKMPKELTTSLDFVFAMDYLLEQN